jgi:hypothetical protein
MIDRAQQHRAARGSRFISALIMALGLLTMVACGTCTIYVWQPAPEGSPDVAFGDYLWTNLVPDIFLSAIIGGVPFALGVILFVIGFRRYRRR